MRCIFIHVVLVLALTWHQRAFVAEELATCKVVRLSDIGWTDVTATTAVAKELLQALGYEAKVSVLSAPVTFASLKNNDIDVFLGNWMPSQEADIRPYLQEASIIQLKKNLEGARFTLAVPDYVYDAGVKNLEDLAQFSHQFKNTLYGIEPGNDGNRLILNMIRDNAFSLKDWRLVESNEQGMLVEVKNALAKQDFIVFLAWEPHPMNLSMNIRYLSGGDDYFGQNFGGASVYTVVRRGFLESCPNVAKLLHNLEFSVAMENELMNVVLNNRQNQQTAILEWLKNNRSITEKWLAGVKTFDDKPGVQALEHYVTTQRTPGFLSAKAPLGAYIAKGVVLLTTHFSTQFRAFSAAIESLVNSILVFILKLHWAVLISIFALFVYAGQRSFSLVLLVVGGFLLIVNLGLWVETIKTLVLVMIAAGISIALGVPLGILAARNSWVYVILQPVLDLMQTIPTFVYLIPTLMLFGLGLVPGLISTVIFAIAAPIRLTTAGLHRVPKELIEASISFGASSWQTLLKVELPYSLPSIKEGFTQAIMLSLSMVVIAGLVGAEGLGIPVIRALNTVNMTQGFEAGLAIVLVAIILDRTLNPKKHKA